MSEAKNQSSVIHVCSLSAVPDVVVGCGAGHLVTCLADIEAAQTPLGILAGRHLRLRMHDIDSEQAGYIAPAAAHVADLVDFVRSWDHRAPMVIHCYAGISRSTAAAYIALCALNPATPETVIARRLREVSAAATPNRRLVSLADAALGRSGRMVEATSGIGQGEFSLAAPFVLPSRFA
jgi:predicted protein tyrosine phosphatase